VARAGYVSAGVGGDAAQSVCLLEGKVAVIFREANTLPVSLPPGVLVAR